MNQKLQQAIVATRAGQKREAQVLLTQVLKEEPEEVHAWYLLSLLVESPRKQRAYLGKVLALDPDHEKARQHLSRLDTAAATADFETESAEEADETEAVEAEPAPAPVPLAAGSDFMAQERGDTLPDWLADDADHLNLDQVELAETAESATVDVLDDSGVPDWLQDDVDDDWTEAEELEPAEEVAATAEAATAAESDQPALVSAQSELSAADAEKLVTKPATKARSRRDEQRKQEAWLSRLLIGLIAVAVVVFVVLVYVIATAF